MIFGFVASTEGVEAIRGKCRDGCNKSYIGVAPKSRSVDLPSPAAGAACDFGCGHQQLPNKNPVSKFITICMKSDVFFFRPYLLLGLTFRPPLGFLICVYL